jgi:hypothetical protein
MKSALMLAAALVLVSGGACAAGIYKSYDAFYAAQPGAVFSDAIKRDSATLYSYAGEQGVHTELQGKLGRKTVRITLAEDRITVNGVAYRYASAVSFPDEHPSDFSPQSADVFLAASANGQPAALCAQGDSNGSGEADRHKQVYLLVNPLAPRTKTTFLHLPSLLSSCRAVLETKDGKLAFPRNTYLLDASQDSRVGLQLRYYTFENWRFVPTANEILLRFIQPEVPFEFLIQDRR